MELVKDFKEFIESLNSAGVRYVVIGGYAVAYHGHPRATEDIDFLVEASNENARRLEKALRIFGFGSAGFEAGDFAQPDVVVHLGRKPLQIDILTSISAVTFQRAWPKRIVANIDGVPVSFIGLQHLVRNKRATGRLKDLADVERILHRNRSPRRKRRRR